MYSEANNLSGAHDEKRHSGSIERHSDEVLVIHDLPTNPYLKGLAWIMVGSIAVASILSTAASQDILSVLIFIVFCVTSVAFLTLGITTEIHVTSRTITKTWKTFTLVRNKVYPLDDYATAEILDRSQLIEGYPLSLFTVALVGSGRRIKVYSADDPEDAKAVQGEIADFVKKAAGSARQRQLG